MKKAVVLGVSIAAGIILIALAVWFTIPRAVFYNSVKGMTEGCSIATYCEKYDVRFDSAVRADLITYTAEFPDSYVREEIKTGDIQCVSYTEGDSKVLIIPNDEPIDGNLLDPDLYNDDDLLGGKSEKAVERIFGSLGYGLPDSFYATGKCTALVNEEDCTYWNMDKTVAYSVLGNLKQVWFPGGADVILYERDNVRAIISLGEDEDTSGVWVANVDVFDTKDLNMPTSIVCRTGDKEFIFKLLNSVEYK